MQRRDVLKTLLLALVPKALGAAAPSVSTLIGTGSRVTRIARSTTRTVSSSGRTARCISATWTISESGDSTFERGERRRSPAVESADTAAMAHARWMRR
jgi:hypothetical protein